MKLFAKAVLRKIFVISVLVCVISVSFIMSPFVTYGAAADAFFSDELYQQICYEDRTEELLPLYASSAVLMDEATGRILYNKNGNERKANASTTKIMTCILALEYGNEEDIVTFSANAARQPDVQMNGCEGEQYYLKDLLFALMLESHNDVAVAIAEHIAGDVETFAGYMNDKAQEVGAFDTHFVTPNGLDADDHYTTACDLAIIARYALHNKEFQEIIRTPAHTFSEISGKRNVAVVNRDGFLTQYEGAIGIKTGFTGNAGYCFVGAAKKNGMTLISVVLASGWPPHKTYKWADTKQLMDYGFSNYSMHTIPDDSFMVPEIPVDRGVDADTVCVCLKEGTSISVPLRENETVRYEWNLPDETKAPVQKGSIAGTVDIYIDQELFASEVLYYAENVEAITYYHELIYVFHRLFMI